jgi:hypothetical protein
MAQIIEEKVTIVISRMVADAAEEIPALDAEFTDSIKAVAQELAGPGVIVEIKED